MTRVTRQLDLFHGHGMNIKDLVRFLNDGAPRAVTVRLTRNRVSMASIDFAGSGPIRVAVDEQFLTAPRPVLTALRAYARSGRQRNWRVVAEYARGLPTHDRSRVRRARLRRRGDVHDLGAIANEVNRDKVRMMLNVYFRQGGQELQINSVDTEVLRAALKNPEAYKDLVVRVAGFSEFFVNLLPEIQQDIIAREAHS